MTYNKTDIELIKQYKSKNLSTKTIVALINKQTTEKYTEEDIVAILNMPDETENKIENPDSRLYDIAAGFVFNPAKRKKFLNVLFIISIVFMLSLVMLGIFVSWKPVIIILSSLFGLVALIALTFFILLKTGLLEKIMEKYGF
jgi:hypothetical protein